MNKLDWSQTQKLRATDIGNLQDFSTGYSTALTFLILSRLAEFSKAPRDVYLVQEIHDQNQIKANHFVVYSLIFQSLMHTTHTCASLPTLFFRLWPFPSE